MFIHVDKKSILKAIHDLNTNNNVLVIGDNLFSIKNISTILNIKQDKYDIGLSNIGYSFSFSYDDGVLKDIVTISEIEEPTTCYSFLIKTNFPYITENECQTIYKEFSSQFWNKYDLTTDFVKTNKAFYDRVKEILTNESEATLNLFEGDFQSYCNKNESINQETYDELINLYHKLLKTKMKLSD